jgi:hypothetical protein
MPYSSTRFTDGFGLVAKPLDECQSELEGWRLGLRSSWSILGAACDFQEAITFLSHLTSPATRHVMVPFGNVTVFMNNETGGSDYADHAIHLCQRLSVRTARVVDVPSRIVSTRTGREALSYEARILEMYQNGNLLRSVACANDGGRWTFQCAGEPHPLEQTFEYQARRKRDRFTPANLKALLEAFGFPFPDLNAIASVGHYVLVREQLLDSAYREKVEAGACTPAQRDDPGFGYYRRGLIWVPHMQTHAESVIIDFERAVRLNPAYEPLVQKHLQRAREVIRGRK